MDQVNYQVNGQVNGPVNTVRLEGKIGNIKKTIYLFMDFHIDVEKQTECEDIRSIDIDKFLIKTFDEAKKTFPEKTYDLFVEYNPLYGIRFSKSQHKGRYLFEQTEKLFRKSVNIDKKGKVSQSKQLNNVRLQYADIREYTTRRYDNIMNSMFDLINQMWNTKSVYYSDFYNLVDGMKLIHAQMAFLYDLIYTNKNFDKPKAPVIFTDNQNILMKYTDKDYQNIAKKLLYKILKRYKNDTVKDIINKFILTDMHNDYTRLFNEFTDTENYLNNLLKEFEPYKDVNVYNILRKQPSGEYFYGIKNRDEIICNVNTLHSTLWDFTAKEIGLQLMDIYVMRRILDKDYITNAVVYTGASHSLNYIRILVKYFGFNITHYSYLKDDNIKKTEEIIMRSNKSTDLNELFLPPVLLQCSNLEKFPKLFT